MKIFSHIGTWACLAAFSALLCFDVRAEDFRKNVVDPRPPHSGPNKPERDDDRHERKHRHDRDKDGNIVIRGYTTIYVPSPSRIIVMQDQQILLDYLRQNLRPGFCPPGVVVSDTGCVPQNYVRRYQVGNGAPQSVVLEPLPPNLVAQLHPPHAQIDNDIVLVNQHTGRIVDAVTLISPTY
jgi:hypothetical protein